MYFSDGRQDLKSGHLKYATGPAHKSLMVTRELIPLNLVRTSVVIL